jgi:cytochrome b6
MNRVVRAQTWIDERLDFAGLLSPLRNKTVPVHRHSAWYLLGGITLFLLLVQVCTGVLLLLYYRPTTAEAFESVQAITYHVHFGWLIRSLHSWSANLMVLCAFAHMFSVAFTRAYRKPRELTWISGVFLLFIVLGFGFSGYLLPWNTRAFFATKVGTEVAGQLPLFGHSIMVMMRGGEDVSGATLTRFFGLHVVILPSIAASMLICHLWLVQQFGISLPPSIELRWNENASQRNEMRFFPNFFLRELMGWYLVFGLLICLAVFLPWQLGVKADPFTPAPPGIKPEWYFLAQFQTLKLLPSRALFVDGEVLGIVAFGLGATLWVGLPFIEQMLGDGGRRSVRLGILVALLYLAVMSVLGYVAK